jgi:hypothetical protein
MTPKKPKPFRRMMDPTQRGDMKAELMRRWYEQNRETWAARHWINAERKGGVADNFCIGMLNEASRILNLSDDDLWRDANWNRN